MEGGPDDEGGRAAEEDTEACAFAVAIEVDEDVDLEGVDGEGQFSHEANKKEVEGDLQPS